VWRTGYVRGYEPVVRQTARSLWTIFMTGFSVQHALIRLASPIKNINYRQGANFFTALTGSNVNNESQIFRPDINGRRN